MKRYSHSCKYRKEKIIGATLLFIGLLIFINSIAVRFLLLLISIALLIMGILLFTK